MEYRPFGQTEMQLSTVALGGLLARYEGLCGQTQEIDLRLEPALNISGRLLHLNSMIPHIAVQVQALMLGKSQDEEARVMATVLSDKNGVYRFVNLKPGQYQLRCYTTRGHVYYQDKQSLQVVVGKEIQNVDFRFAAFKKGRWKSYTRFDGLPGNQVRAIHQDADGMMWFGTNNGICRYDGERFETFTTSDGLAGDNVWAIYRQPDGPIWFGSWDGGICRYDGDQFETFTHLDEGPVTVIEADAAGNLWFGGGFWGTGNEGKGLWRYDGQRFDQFTTEDGLDSDAISALHCADDGTIWIGHLYGGISRYDLQPEIEARNQRKFTTFSQADGLTGTSTFAIEETADGVIWFGRFAWGRPKGGLIRYDGHRFEMLTTEDGLPSNAIDCIYLDSDGVLWLGTGGMGNHHKGGVVRYDGQGMVNFNTTDGLAGNQVNTIYQTPDGSLWFGTDNGLSVYNQTEFLNLTIADGLAHNEVTSIHRDPDGRFWFGTDGGGVSSYDGQRFVNFTTQDGLTDNQIRDIARVEVVSSGESRRSELWLSTRWGGVSRYDGEKFIPFTVKEGLLFNQIGGTGLTTTIDGSVWICTLQGISVYDGKSVVSADGKFSELVHLRRDGFSKSYLSTLMPDQSGVVWIGTWGAGILQYDGQEFTKYTTTDGLIHNNVNSIFRQTDGLLWFGTANGISSYDGQTFTNLGAKGNEFTTGRVDKIYQSPDGMLWLATDKGVVIYANGVWSILDHRDGLAGNRIKDIYADSDGSFWFATNGGVSHYKRPEQKHVLRVRIVSVQTDLVHTELESLPAIKTGQRVTLAYRAIDLKTVAQKRQYQISLRAVNGKSEIEEKVTSANKLDHIFKQPGDYTFEVVTIDRDLVFSEAARLKLTVVPTWYMNGWIMIPASSVVLVILILALVNGVRYYQQRRESERLELEAQQLQARMLEQERETRLALEAELADAHQMQMALLPESAPSTVGLQIAGRNIAAKEVGGDFFDYLEGSEQLAIAVGDVSGKGLKGAMNAVMASGILKIYAEQDSQPTIVMSHLNNSLCQSMEQDMNVTMVLAQFDLQQKQMTLANAGQHAYPLLKRGTSVEAVKAKGLALGMIPSIPYKSLTLDLQSGDLLLLMTDGITEPRNAEGLMYEESGRFHQVISGLSDDLNAEEVVETIIQDVIDHLVDEEERDDDITLVAVKVT